MPDRMFTGDVRSSRLDPGSRGGVGRSTDVATALQVELERLEDEFARHDGVAPVALVTAAAATCCLLSRQNRSKRLGFVVDEVEKRTNAWRTPQIRMSEQPPTSREFGHRL